MRSNNLFCTGLLLRAAVLAVDPLMYPATLEVDVVFPRNDTYLVASPFPVIFAIQNAGAFLEFDSTRFGWSVNCKNHSLVANPGEFRHDRMTAPTEPWFFINVAEQPDESDFIDKTPAWRGPRDVCVLKWSVDFYEICNRRSDGSLSETYGVNGPVYMLSGNLTFTLAPDNGIKLMDQLLAYSDCPVYGNSVQVASKEHTSSNVTVCAHIVSGQPPPPSNPCAVKFANFSQSVVALIPTPTAISTPTSTPRSSAGRGMRKGVTITSLTESSAFARLLGACGIVGALALL